MRLMVYSAGRESAERSRDSCCTRTVAIGTNNTMLLELGVGHQKCVLSGTAVQKYLETIRALHSLALTSCHEKGDIATA